MILNVLHLPRLPSLITRSWRAIIDVSPMLFRVCGIPCYTQAHARTETSEIRARGGGGEGGGGGGRGGGSVSRRTVGTWTGPGSGISGGRGTPSTPRMQPIYLDSRRVSLECAFRECAASSSILAGKRSPRAAPRAQWLPVQFFVIDVSYHVILTFCARMIFAIIFILFRGRIFSFFF